MFPLLFILFPLLLASEAAELDALVVDVVVQGDDIPADMGLLLNNSTLNIIYEPLPALDVLSTPQGDEERLRNASVDAILRLRMNESILEYAVLYLSTSEQKFGSEESNF